ncbi:MAG: hypothetical protein M1831_002688 [Alyxoria varia]|nr:MAG: hypothetical protein M1831_002688 [Alyxoria varia]
MAANFVAANDQEAQASKGAYRVTPRRSSGGYHKYVPVIAPETEAFVLPSGTVTCPIPECPRYQKPCNPNWRLNEHMKTRHGWPRKRTQPLTDKRLSGSQRSEFYDRSTTAPQRNGKYTSKYCVRDDSPSDVNPSAGDNASPMSDPPAQSTRSAARKGKERASMRKVSFLDTDIEMQDADATEPETPNPGEEDTTDHAMVEELKLLIAQLTTIDKSSGQDSNGHTMPIVGDLQRMLENGSLKVNTIVSASEGLSLSKLYKLLANRRNQVASIHEMSSMTIDVPTKFGPPTLPQSSALSWNGNRTQKKGNVNHQPPTSRPGPKLTLTTKTPRKAKTTPTPKGTDSTKQPTSAVNVSSQVSTPERKQPAASSRSARGSRTKESVAPTGAPVRRPGPPEKGNFALTPSGKSTEKPRPQKSVFTASSKPPAPKDVGGFTALNQVLFGSPPSNNNNIKLGKQPHGSDDSSEPNR